MNSHGPASQCGLLRCGQWQCSFEFRLSAGTRSRFAALCGFFRCGRRRLRCAQLDGVGIQDGGEQAGEARLDLRAARGIEHFHAVAFAADEAVLAQDFEVLRQSRFGDGLLAYGEEGGTVLRATLGRDRGIDGDTRRIGQRVEDALDGNVFDRGMNQRPHVHEINAGGLLVQ